MNKNGYFSMRINPKMKESWEKYVENSELFDDVSKLIRYCVNSYIIGGLIESNKDNPQRQAIQKELQETNIEYQNEVKELHKKLEEMSEHLRKIDISKSSKEAMELKNRILIIIKKVPMTYQDLAPLVFASDEDTAEALADLVKIGDVYYNDNMEFYVKPSEEED